MLTVLDVSHRRRSFRPGASRLVTDMPAVRYADASGLQVLVNSPVRSIALRRSRHGALAVRC